MGLCGKCGKCKRAVRVLMCADNAENAGKCIEVFANPAKIGGNIDICWRDCWLERFRGLYLQSTCRRADRLR